MKNVLKEIWNQIPVKYRYLICFCLGFGLLGILLLSSCSSIKTAMKNYPQDNIIEESLEEVIESQTGFDIDLSPFSEEK